MLTLRAYCTRCEQETIHERQKLFKDRYGLGLTTLFGPVVLPFWLVAAGADLAVEWRCTGCGIWRRLRFQEGSRGRSRSTARSD